LRHGIGEVNAVFHPAAVRAIGVRELKPQPRGPARGIDDWAYESDPRAGFDGPVESLDRDLLPDGEPVETAVIDVDDEVELRELDEGDGGAILRRDTCTGFAMNAGDDAVKGGPQGALLDLSLDLARF